MMRPEWFFRTYDDWDWWDRELLPLVRTGPVLDLGCAAGRAALYLQERGIEVTAIDSSPGCVEVARRRGVRDARVGDLNDPPSDKEWGAVLLLCGNLGLGGTWDANRSLLRRLAEITLPGAVLLGDSVNPRKDPQVSFRIYYGTTVSPWWQQRNVAAREVESLVAGTGWAVERQLEDGDDHSVLLRRA
jgi:SAM-dependent methyltransferase